MRPACRLRPSRPGRIRPTPHWRTLPVPPPSVVRLGRFARLTPYLGVDSSCSCFNALVTGEPGAGWFAVRCVFRQGWPLLADDGHAGSRYEERITLWRAANVDEAIEKAEREALDYAAAIDDAPDEYLGLAQAYALVDLPDDGAEVFSLIRDSTLEPDAYLDSFFDTGREHQDRSVAG